MNRKLSEIFPHGCAEKQRDKLRSELYKQYGNGILNWKNWSAYAKQLDREMDALNMLESCFAYGGISNFYAQHEAWEYCGKGSHYEHYLKAFEEVGGEKEEFDRMIEIQSCYLTEKCDVISAGYDCEGLSYNGIVLREV